MKQFSQACENNKGPILQALREHLVAPGVLLEIGCGTGQHAVHMARHLPHVQWQPSDVPGGLNSVRAWIAEAALANVCRPLELDVWHDPWPVAQADYVYSANTAHIMHWTAVERMITGAAKILDPGGEFCLYGPFNYQGHYTSDSNRRFDQYLSSVDVGQGIRDREAVGRVAELAGLVFVQDYPMPANNRLLIWQSPATVVAANDQ